MDKALALATESAPESEASKLEEAVAAVTDAGETAEGPASEQGLLDLYEEEAELDVVPVATTPAVDQVWTPESEAPTSADAGDEDRRGTALPQRRVQRAQAHERALELTGDEADEPELG